LGYCWYNSTFLSLGQEGYKNIRPLSYPGTHVFIICFSIVNRVSFENVDAKWWPEIKQTCPNTPVILCGTKLDLRKDKTNMESLELKGEKAVTLQEGEELQKKIGSATYIECSAMTREGLSKVFQAAIIASMKKPQKKTTKCLIL
jgi:Ras-related C3 botulinum toxin substrate 1